MKSLNSLKSDSVKNYFRFLYQPSKVIQEIASKPVNLFETLIIILISSILLVSGVFLVGDVLYSSFQYYSYTYPLEILTSGQLFGYYLPQNAYVLVFISNIIFCLKAWIFLSVLLFGFLRLFKQQISIKWTAQIIAWGLFPFAILMFIASLICLGLKYIFPLIYHYVYYGILAAVFIGIAPLVIYYFLAQLKDVSVYNALRSYYLSLFVVFVIFTINHADAIMNLVW